MLQEKGSFQKSPCLDILEKLEILENPQTVENRGESDYFPEFFENILDLEILEVPSVKKTPFIVTPFSGPETTLRTSGQKARSGPLNRGRKQAFWHGHATRTSTKELRSEKPSRERNLLNHEVQIVN